MNDPIDRQAAIDAMEDVDWYHINKDGQLIHGANSKEDEPLYKAEDVYKVLNDMPSAQPDLSGYSDRLWKAAYERGKAEAQPDIIRCKECRYYEWMSNRVPDEQTWFCHNWNAETGKDDFCSYAERRE